MTDPFAPLEADIAAARQQEAAQQAAAVAAAVKAQADADAVVEAGLQHQIDMLEHPPAPTPAATAWGSSVWPMAGETYPQALARVQKQLAPAILRHFVTGTGGPAWPTQTGSMPLVISFKLPPAQVLDGTAAATSKPPCAATPRLTYWSYWHEPEDDIARGAYTAQQYRDAWAHIAAIAKASPKASLLKATLILMGWTLTPASGRHWSDYYPGGDVIDVLAWDCYLWSATDTPQHAYDQAHAVSAAAGKPWAVAETGAGAAQFTPAARQAALTAMSSYLAKLAPAPLFVTYFDASPGGSDTYRWPISNDPAAAAAWKAGQTR